VFLDRDGTMIHEVGYLDRREDVRWFPWTVDAIRLLNRAEYLVCVVTNQGGIALGLFDEPFVNALHAEMEAELRANGAVVDGWFLCPHHPRGVITEGAAPCECRKPGRGMIDAACARFDIDLSQSWVVGDRDVDVQMASAVGARGILVRTGHGERDLRHHSAALPEGTTIAMDLIDAVTTILSWPSEAGSLDPAHCNE
jgi:D-glycero-D-manno-heptose 1,7-bisphosphate phosphatase